MKLIVGLGNPGKEYEKTRHNVGWMVLNLIAKKLSSESWQNSKKTNADFLKINTGNDQIELLKPLTFMNNSGQSVAYAVKNHTLNPETDLIVVHDDKDIPLGEIKIQINRSAAGHNGVKSIIDHLKTQNFTRVRVGVAPKNKIEDTAKFILKKFGLLEKSKLNESLTKAVDEIGKLANF